MQQRFGQGKDFICFVVSLSFPCTFSWIFSWFWYPFFWNCHKIGYFIYKVKWTYKFTVVRLPFYFCLIGFNFFFVVFRAKPVLCGAPKGQEEPVVLVRSQNTNRRLKEWSLSLLLLCKTFFHFYSCACQPTKYLSISVQSWDRTCKARRVCTLQVLLSFS